MANLWWTTNPLVLIGLQGMLDWNKLGWEIAGTARNGKEALELVKELRPDLVVCDIKMPVMSGLALAQKCQELDLGLPVFIMLTSFEEFDYVKRFINLGVLEYLVKLDLTPQSLENALRRAELRIQRERALQNRTLDTKRLATLSAGVTNMAASTLPKYMACTVTGMDLRHFSVLFPLSELDGWEERISAVLETAGEVVRGYFGTPVWWAVGKPVEDMAADRPGQELLGPLTVLPAGAAAEDVRRFAVLFRQNRPVGRPYPLLFAGDGVFPAAAGANQAQHIGGRGLTGQKAETCR